MLYTKAPLRTFSATGSHCFLHNTHVTHIDKSDPRAPTECKDYRIHTLKTKAPMAINIEDVY